MDKTILKNFAIYSRNKLIQETKLKASMLGINEDGIQEPLPESTSDMLVFDIKSIDTHKIHGSDVRKYHRLINELDNRTKTSEDYLTAYTSLIEEVAYTWFNRLLAIRFMEVNNYMPDRVRVLSNSQKGIIEPEIMSQYNATSIEFSQAEESQLIEWQLDGSAQAMNSMFQFLFIKQCNKLNDNLPDLFETTNDYTELLLTVSYNDQEGVLYKLVNEIPESYFDIESSDSYGQIEIIGWIYQYYNTELKDEVFARPASQKISKHDIPAVTQLFTPDWIVKYMVENSLGRLWIEKLIAEGDYRLEKEIAKEFDWKYYIPEADQEDEVAKELEEIRKERKILKLEEIKFMDPAMGSFHIGVYAFEIFMQLYKSQGYVEREAAISIIENNLYGLDIDKRAYQLSYFAIMMKGRQYNRSLLSQNVHNNLNTIKESNNINRDHLEYMGPNFTDKSKRKDLIKQINEILDIFIDAKEYGSILKVPNNYNFDELIRFVKEEVCLQTVTMRTVNIDNSQNQLLDILKIAKNLALKFEVVVTNPPYLGSRTMNQDLKRYLNKEYNVSKADLFAVFIELCKNLTKSSGFYSMITQDSWMFLSSYETLRERLLNNIIINMLHLGTKAFEEITGEVVQTTTFVIKKVCLTDYNGSYIRLCDFKSSLIKSQKLIKIKVDRDEKFYFNKQQRDFDRIPGTVYSYMTNEKVINTFIHDKLGEVLKPRQGLASGDVDYFRRQWFEVNHKDVGFQANSIKEFHKSKKKYAPINDGGKFRKWYGNNESVLKFDLENYKRLSTMGNKLPSKDLYFQKGITWSAITNNDLSLRYFEEGYLFTNAGMAIFGDESKLKVISAFLNSVVVKLIITSLNESINYNKGDIEKLPVNPKIFNNDKLLEIVEECVLLAREDWNIYETSWGFQNHFLINFNVSKLSSVYKEEKNVINNNFNSLKENEKEINRIFIKIYGLENELTPEVSDRNITITKIFDSKEDIYYDIKGNIYIQTKKDIIKSFISYAVGCMFGRYSLDEEGLIFAGGEWDISRYEKFIPTLDNVLIISEDEYFEDDIVNRFVDFVKVVYGKETLDENLEFVADALGGRGTPKEIIRNYFVKDFYKHHVQMYKKRPIYWLYDSGRNNGFKALVYMHRYNEDTTGVVRIDHLHKMQTAYEHRMDNLRYEITHSDNARDRNRAEKELDKLTKQLKETKDYDEKIGHLAIARIGIDLDDGVKVNHAKVQTDEKGENLNILAKI